MKKFNNKHEGFTLIELLVALGILTILALLGLTAFDGSRSKAQALISFEKQMGDANIMLKNDTGCYVKTPKALIDFTEGPAAANNFCNKDFGSSWTQPYMAKFPVDTNGDAKTDKIAAGSIVGIGVEAGGTGNSGGKLYFIKATGLPADVVKQALNECNGSNADQAAFSTAAKCRGIADTGTFDMAFDETR